jgi:hypothetical protein
MKNRIFALSVIGFCLVSAICVDAQQSGKRSTRTGKRVNKPQPTVQQQSPPQAKQSDKNDKPTSPDAGGVAASQSDKKYEPDPQIAGIGIIFKRIVDRLMKEDAIATGLRNILIEYLTAKGKYFDRGAVGYGTDIKCTFERMDQAQIATNWDSLIVEKKSSEMEIKGMDDGPAIGIGGPLAELMLYGALRKSFNDAIPVLKILKPAAKSKPFR